MDVAPRLRWSASGDFRVKLTPVASSQTNPGQAGKGARPLGFLLSIALAIGVIALLRRTRQADNEARRLSALLDGLDEGVAVCRGMQAIAVNSSLCRLIGMPSQCNPLTVARKVCSRWWRG